MKDTLKRRLTSRKFLGSVVVFATALILLLNGVIGPQLWANITIVIYATYAGSNVIEKGAQLFAKDGS